MKFRFPSADGAEIYITTSGETDLSFPPGVLLAMPCQTHSSNIGEIKESSEIFPETDGLITFNPDISVGVRTADCVPLLFYASDIKAVAAVHAGWRGTIAGIGIKTVDMLVEKGASPENIHIFISAAICGDCYEVSEELEEEFRKAGYSEGISCRHLDLKTINREALMKAGIPEANITVSDFCTRHTKGKDGEYLFPSWRRTPGTKERLISAICLGEHP